MNINLIVAIDQKNGIGKNNLLPWHLPADLKHFKTITTWHPIIMGRKTFDSIGKALPNRRNIVISRQSGLVIPGAELCSSLNNAIKLCKDEKDIFVIGGAQIFEQALPVANILYLTIIHEDFDADVFFPVINMNEWTEEEKILHEPDEKNLYSYSFIKYKKA
ncbi:dihydrofolate reductase [Daejeonella sp.]|uniref:dihydrofolate reductase n=1 Tax=Daejeonella sp. TaxID=2805397 RepID=UPI0027251336|nr:dihydrofolate reductase [Daejeonella sp.]MDO8991819.1 dihydrofolate reductase [Daejeonella sp.]MDP2412776.1 dihydrofolate reductase [Daejeonella sp.]